LNLSPHLFQPILDLFVLIKQALQLLQLALAPLLNISVTNIFAFRIIHVDLHIESLHELANHPILARF
jgi:hypothetical protein